MADDSGRQEEATHSLDWSEKKYRPYRALLRDYWSRALAIDEQRQTYKENSTATLSALVERLAIEYMMGVPPISIQTRAYALLGEFTRRWFREHDPASGERKPWLVQYVGAIALHEKRIVEMLNGEGKTLMATLPAFLHLLPNLLLDKKDAARRSVHIVTDNAYLTRRDAQEYGPLLHALGFSVGAVWAESDPSRSAFSIDDVGAAAPCSKKEAYERDLVYVEKSAIIFDYLRDNRIVFTEERLLGKLDFAIVDEADSILIDQAREIQPLSEIPPWTEAYPLQVTRSDHLARLLLTQPNRYLKWRENGELLGLTKAGEELCCTMLQIDSLYHHPDRWYRFLWQALKAHTTRPGTIYLFQDGHIIPIDEKTGRQLEGRRFGGGFHPALEAKHGLKPIGAETSIVAQISVQNFFKQYTHLAGMTGTAEMDRREYADVYDLQLVCIPPRQKRKLRRHSDSICVSDETRWQELVNYVIALHEIGNPILISVATEEKALKVARLLRSHDLCPVMLTAASLLAANDEQAGSAGFDDFAREDAVIENAGKPYAVTVTTRLAGRGTDIKPQPEVEKIGGLVVIGAERIGKRADEQLAGRTARRGLSGIVKFFLSYEDELLQRFGGADLRKWLSKNAAMEVVCLENAQLDRIIQNAQDRLHNYDYEVRRKQYRYDNVLHEQRHELHRLREQILSGTQMDSLIDDLAHSYIENIVARCLDGSSEEWRLWDLRERCTEVGITDAAFEGIAELSREQIQQKLEKALLEWLSAHRRHTTGLLRRFGLMHRPEAILLLQVLNEVWSDHLEGLQDIHSDVGMLHTGDTSDLALAHYEKRSRARYREAFHSAEQKFLTRWRELARSDSHTLQFIADSCERARQWESLLAVTRACLTLEPQNRTAVRQQGRAFVELGQNKS